MKKILATMIALSIPAAALADDNQGFYIQGDLGHASVKGKVYGENATAKGFSPRLSAGYDFGNFRVAADYTHYKSRIVAGVGYDITQNIALDAGYRYNYWGKFDGVKVDSHEVSAGVRVKF